MNHDLSKTWKVVAEFSGVSKPEDRVFLCLDALVRAVGIQNTRLECKAGPRALIVPLVSLCTVVKQPAREVLVEGSSELDMNASDKAVFVSPIQEQASIEGLFSLLNSGAIETRPPRWAGVHEPSEQDQWLLIYLQTLGAVESNGTLTVKDSSGESAVFTLYHIPPSPAQMKKSLTWGAALKDAEEPDNLRRRAEWFRRRAGTSE